MMLLPRPMTAHLDPESGIAEVFRIDVCIAMENLHVAVMG